MLILNNNRCLVIILLAALGCFSQAVTSLPWGVVARHRLQSSSLGLPSVLSVRGGADAEMAPKKKKKKSSKKKKVVKEETVSKETPPHKDPEADSVAADQPKKTKKKKPKLSKAAKAHVSKEILSTSPNYRIQRELKEFLKDPPEGLTVQVGKNLRVWIVTIEGPGIYKGETFRLRIAFPPQYPVVPPSVYFLQPHLPV